MSTQQRIKYFIQAKYPDHTKGDKTRLALVKRNYLDTLKNAKEIREYVQSLPNDPKYKTAKEFLTKNVNDRLTDIRPYFNSYQHFYQTKENADVRFLFDKGLPLIRAWFQGWYMSKRRFKYDSYKDLLRAFRAAQYLFPAKQDKVLYRVMPTSDIDQISDKTKLVTGPRALQSWTETRKSAIAFYNSVYANGETMVVTKDGYIDEHNYTKSHNFILICAKINKDSIVWQPHTIDQLDAYDMHSQDSKLYDERRLRDNVRDTLLGYQAQKEYVVYVSHNRAIPILKMWTLHVKDAPDDQTTN